MPGISDSIHTLGVRPLGADSAGFQMPGRVPAQSATSHPSHCCLERSPRVPACIMNVACSSWHHCVDDDVAAAVCVLLCVAAPLLCCCTAAVLLHCCCVCCSPAQLAWSRALMQSGHGPTLYTN
jgi:hypothetical protein